MRGAAKGINPRFGVVTASKTERLGRQFLHAHIGLHTARRGDAVLGHRSGQGERLPEIGIGRGRNTNAQGHVQHRWRLAVVAKHRQRPGHVGVDRRIVSLREGGLRKTIRSPVSQDGVANALAEFRRSGAVGERCLSNGGRVAKGSKLGVKIGQVRRRTRSRGVTAAQHAVGGIADGLGTRGFDIGRQRRDLLVVNVTGRGRIVGGPGIVHGRRRVEEVAGVCRRIGHIDADGRQVLFIPGTGRRVLGLRPAQAEREHDGQQ